MIDESNHKQQATTVFVLGLLGLLMCQVLSPVAMFMGNKYVAECRAFDIEPDGLGVAGRILGIVGTILFALSMVVVVIYFVAIFAMIASGNF